MMTCKGCIYYKKSTFEWPCNECSRMGSGIVDQYTLPGESTKFGTIKTSGRWQLVDKGDHYVTEEV